jgi:hypothetical protein
MPPAMVCPFHLDETARRLLLLLPMVMRVSVIMTESGGHTYLSICEPADRTPPPTDCKVQA